MLEIDGITAGYGTGDVLHALSFKAEPGAITCVMGRNGAGKTTTLRTIMGQVRPRSGAIRLDAVEISTLSPHRIPALGIGYIPQGRRLFPDLTVAETLEIGLMARRKGKATREKVLAMFPRLEERLTQRAVTLSGGEQQMLATARALCLEPHVMLLDEPTEGLQPSMIALIREAVRAMRDDGVAVILVEQRVAAVQEIADKIVFIENGRTAQVCTPDDTRNDPSLFQKYVGV